MLGKEFGVKLVVRMRNTEQMEKKKPVICYLQKKPVQERKCSYNYLLGLAVNSTYVVIKNTCYLCS